MTKNLALAAALLSLAVLIGCSSAHTPNAPVEVSVSLPNGISVLYVGQAVQVTATVTNSVNKAVTWTLNQNGTDCTNNPSLCGTLSSTTANPVTYTAPSTPQTVTIVATSQGDSSASGSDDLSITAISLQVTPYASGVGVGLTQQYTAVVVPDDAPQGVSWLISNCSGGPCGSIDASSGVYTAPGSAGGTATIQASASAPLSGIGAVPATVVSSRLAPSTTYAFRFSGYDGSTTFADAFVGNIVVGSDGKTIAGSEDELRNGTHSSRSLSGSFTPISNNRGTITVTPQGESAYTYNVVFDAAGDVQMIEADTNGTGSGVMEPVTGKFNNNASLTGSFVFGFTGIDVSNNRTGYVGLVPMDGQGHIGSGGVAGMIDINDNGPSSATDIIGTYTMSNGVGSMTITSTSLGKKTFNFNLYGVSGQLNAGNPATMYAVSTDSNPEVTGTVVFQDSKLNFTNADLNSTAVIGLTGTDNGGSNVSLTRISPDKKGNFTGGFDQNDNGTVQSITNLSNTYNATGGGRLTINLLGNSGKSLPFVLYLSAANTGFLLDQSSASVMTGTMTPQFPKGNTYSPSVIPGTYALATTSSATSSVDPIVANGLITWVNTGNCTSQCANATLYDSSNPNGVAIAGTYTLASNGAGGTGSGGSLIVLTTPSNQTFVIYMLDAFDFTNPTKDTNHFLMFEEDKGVNNASLINAQQ